MGIKDMVVSLAQILAKSLVIGVVVVDIPTRFGMLLSRSWGAKLGGVLKLEFSYVVIPIFGGKERRLYRETIFIRKITNNEASNSLVYSQEKDDFLASCCMTMQNWLKITEAAYFSLCKYRATNRRGVEVIV